MAKHPDNAFTVHGEAIQVVSPHLILSYPSLIKTRAFEGNEPKFQASFIFPKSYDITALKAAIQAAKAAKWGATPPPKLKLGIRDGVEKVVGTDGDGKEVYAKGYGPDVFFIGASANKDRPPQLLNAAAQQIDRNDVETCNKLFYGGAVVRAIIRAFAYDQRGNKGVSFGLNAVQFIKHGEALGGGGIDASSVFDDESDIGGAGGATVSGAPSKSDIDALFG
jgi:hypothetical protein